MVGTVFASWLESSYQRELAAIAGRAFYVWAETGHGEPWTLTRNESGLYGMSHYVETGRVSLDGGCGLESMLTIAETIGVRVRKVVRRGRVVGFDVEGADNE